MFFTLQTTDYLFFHKGKQCSLYLCVFWFWTERLVISFGYPANLECKGSATYLPAKELLSGASKKIFTMGVPTKLTRAFCEALDKLAMCPGLLWCWLDETGSDCCLPIYFISSEGKHSYEDRGTNSCLFELEANCSASSWSSALLRRDQALQGCQVV